MEVLQLLVEIVAQSLQFVGVAQFVGVDDFVEAGGEGLVLGPALLRGLRLREAALRRLFRFPRFPFVLEFRRRRVDGVERPFVGVIGRLVGRFALHRILSRLVFALALSLLGFFGRRLFLRLLVRFFGVGVGIARQPQGREDLAHEPRVGALVERALLSRSRSAPAFSSIKGRQSSTRRSAPRGGSSPVSRSRTSIATASSSGASSRVRASANGLRW